MFWVVFQLGSLIGFIFLGIAAFKLTPDQMNAEAGKFRLTPLNLTLCIYLSLTYSFQHVFYQHSMAISFSPLVCYPRFIVGCRLARTLLFFFVDCYCVVSHDALSFFFTPFSSLTFFVFFSPPLIL